MSGHQSAKVQGHYHGTTFSFQSVSYLSGITKTQQKHTQEEEGEPGTTVTDRFPQELQLQWAADRMHWIKSAGTD